MLKWPGITDCRRPPSWLPDTSEHMSGLTEGTSDNPDTTSLNITQILLIFNTEQMLRSWQTASQCWWCSSLPGDWTEVDTNQRSLSGLMEVQFLQSIFTCWCLEWCEEGDKATAAEFQPETSISLLNIAPNKAHISATINKWWSPAGPVSISSWTVLRAFQNFLWSQRLLSY